MDMKAQKTSPETPWALRAIAQVSRMRPPSVLSLDQPAKSGPKPSAGYRWHPAGKSRHNWVEMVLALEPGVISVQGQTHRFRPPALAILPPGASHCEGTAGANLPYLSLWISGVGESLFAFVSRYRPGHGWDVPWLQAMQGPVVRRFIQPLESAACASLLRGDAGQFGRFRADLLILLAELHARHLTFRGVPEEPSRAGTHAEMIGYVHAFLSENIHRPMRLHEVARLTHWTPHYINRLFRRQYGEAVHGFVDRLRMEKAMSLIRGTDLLLKEIAGQVGFSDPLYFSRRFHRHFGCSPSAVSRSHKSIPAQ